MMSIDSQNDGAEGGSCVCFPAKIPAWETPCIWLCLPRAGEMVS